MRIVGCCGAKGGSDNCMTRGRCGRSGGGGGCASACSIIHRRQRAEYQIQRAASGVDRLGATKLLGCWVGLPLLLPPMQQLRKEKKLTTTTRRPLPWLPDWYHKRAVLIRAALGPAAVEYRMPRRGSSVVVVVVDVALVVVVVAAVSAAASKPWSPPGTPGA